MNRILQCIQFIYRFSRKISRDRVRAHSAEAAFFIILCFFPILMLLLTLVQFTPIDQTQVLYAMEEITPFEVTELMEPILDSIFNQSTAHVSWTAIAALWAAGKSILGLADGLNSIYRIEERRNYFVMRIRAAFYTFVLILALLLSLLLLVFGYRLQEYLREWIPFFEKISDMMFWLPTAIAMAVLFLLFLVLYSFLPNRRMKLKSQLPGAIFTSVAWSVFSYAFSIYLDFSVNMSVIYGSLTTLVVVMLWLYFCMYLLFVGAEINDYIAYPDLF